MTSMSRHFLDRRKLLSQLCKTLHFCILKCMFSTYSGLEVIAANGCIFKNLYLAMCHDDTSVISLHHFFRTGNGNPLLGNSEILLKKKNKYEVVDCTPHKRHQKSVWSRHGGL